MNHVRTTATALVFCRITVGEKRLPLVPWGHRCQGHLCAAVFHCVLLHSSQHAAWLHKTLNAWECPTAGRLELQQSCCAAPTRVPLPPVPDSLHQLSAHLSRSLPRRLYLYLRRLGWGFVRTALLESLSELVWSVYVCLSRWVTKRSALIKISICCLREW